jgi:glutathione S-transferase
VKYTLTPARPHSPEVNAIHPLGKVPAFRHDAVELCESKAISTYIDTAFPGPALIPRDAAGAARCEQWISLINTAIDPVLMRQYLLAYFFSGLPDGAPDRARIEAALPKMREIFSLLDKEVASQPYIAGDAFTLADAFLLPIIDYMRVKPESQEMLASSPHVQAWFDRVMARPSAKETVPPPIPTRN